MGNNYIIDGSFQLLRTNPLLTTNLQIVVDSTYDLYLETINSHKYLSDDKYKHFSISKQSFLEDKIPEFYDGLPINIAFYVNDDYDEDVVYDTYDQQFDTLYWSGVSKVKENEFYKEEFEYFAPLYIYPENIPDGFVILRVDDPGIYKTSENDKIIDRTTKENFREEIVKKWKCVSCFDMSRTTSFGYWLDKNYTSNVRFPKAPFEFDSKEYNFSRWYGINYFTGVYTNKSLYMNDVLRYENPHFRFEKFITENYKNNELIFPNIANFKFLFDDTPASPFEYKDYSLNRYFGFYVDLELVKTITPYKSTTLKNGLKVENNIFMLENQVTGSTMPFDIVSWNSSKDYYVFAGNDLYRVDRVLENGEYYYKIISNLDLTIDDITRENEVDIIFNDLGNKNYNNYIRPRTELTIYMDRLIDDDGVHDLYADLYLIKIDEKYHVIESSINEFDGRIEHFIRTDYGVECNWKTLKYWIISEDNENGGVSVTKLVEDNDKPIKFDIYRLKFRDVKDFDFDRVDTGFANFDCEINDEYGNITEQKLYATEHRDASDSLVFKTYDKKDANSEKVINVSSEYISTDELFEINKNGLSDIWRKNQSKTKWGYKQSISHSDYPYKLNNSNKVGFLFNRTTDPLNRVPDVMSKTHDFFYRIGDFYDATVVSDDNNLFYEINTTKKYYDNQTLSIETESYNTSYFDLDKYIDSDFDYFDYFFKNNRYLNNDIDISTCETIGYKGDYVQTTHYSIINDGDKYSPSSTLFKGIKYNFNWLKSVVRYDDIEEKIKTIIYDKTKNLNGYKFSVILRSVFSELDWSPCLELQKIYDNLVLQISEIEEQISIYTIQLQELETILKPNKDKKSKIDRLKSLIVFLKNQIVYLNIRENYDNLLNCQRNQQAALDSYNIEHGTNYTDSININSDVEIPLTSVKTNRTDVFDKDGIHIFLNDKFKNVLIIIDKKFTQRDASVLTLNNVTAFDEREGLYYNKLRADGDSLYYDWDSDGFIDYEPSLLIASNYIMALNSQNTLYFDQYNKYHYISEKAEYSYGYINSTIETSRNPSGTTLEKFQFIKMYDWNNDYPPFIVNCELPTLIKTKKDSYTYAAIKGPKYNIYDKYKIDYTETNYTTGFIKEPLARYIVLNEKEPDIKHEYKTELIYDNSIFRYNGPYEPIFKDVELYKPIQYFVVDGGFFSQKRCGSNVETTAYSTNKSVGTQLSLSISALNVKINDVKDKIRYFDDKLSIISNQKNDIDYLTDKSKQEKLLSEELYYTNLKDVNEILLASYISQKTTLVDETQTGVIRKVSSNTKPIWIFDERVLGVCDGDYSLCELALVGTNVRKDSDLLIFSNFNFQLPLDANISGVSVQIKRRAKNYDEFSIITDNVLQFSKPDLVMSDDYGRFPSGATGFLDITTDYSDYIWNVSNSSITYGGQYDLWGFDSLSAQELNDSEFKLNFSVSSFKARSTPTIINVAYLDCLCVTVYYTLPDVLTGNTYRTSVNRNIIFDTELSSFGMIDELMYSKVNENENPLKIQNTEEDRSIYPMVDEFGLSYDRRFIFKSSWDNDYYIRTKNELDE